MVSFSVCVVITYNCAIIQNMLNIQIHTRNMFHSYTSVTQQIKQIKSGV